jgi:hypothetical protein
MKWVEVKMHELGVSTHPGGWAAALPVTASSKRLMWACLFLVAVCPQRTLQRRLF